MSEQKSVEYLRNLAQEIIDDPEIINNLSAEECVELRKHCNPMNNIISSDKIYANLGVTNLRDTYLKRLHVTALIGFLYRMLDEFEPDTELKIESTRFDRLSKKTTDADELDLIKTEHANRVKVIKNTSKKFIKEFLDKNLSYNPDTHVRGSHSSNNGDPEHLTKLNQLKHQYTSAVKNEIIENDIKNNTRESFHLVKNMLLSIYQLATDSLNQIKSSLKVQSDSELSSDDKHLILIKKYKELNLIVEQMKDMVLPMTSFDTLNSLKINPPVDLFHHFDRYYNNHYEQLRDIVNVMYNEKPDLEFAVTLYSTHSSLTAAQTYIEQHKNEFISEVFTIENSATCLLGPFKENRERINYYNKNTDILRKMTEQLELDHKLGKDLMEKRVKVQKKKNIEEAGPDAPGLAEYSKSMNQLRDYGVKQILTREDQLEIERLKKQTANIQEDYEVPDDAIQMDIFYSQQDEEGNPTLQKRKLYTQAEAPLHLQENSEYTASYQPRRVGNQKMIDSYKTKKIIDKNGKEVEIVTRADH